MLAGVAFILGSLWTCSTAATRACRARARRSAPSSTRRSTASRRASCSPRWPPTSPSSGNEFAVGATVLAVVGSYMVSYTRARAEALGVECKVGIASRAVRVVILSAGLVFAAGELIPDFDLLEPAIYVMAALTVFTALQRVLHVRRQLGAASRGRRVTQTSLGGCVLSMTDYDKSTSNGGSRYQTDKVRVAIVGVGNCASSFVQGVEYYKDADPERVRPGPHARRPRRLPRPRHRVHAPPSTSTPTRSARTSPRRSGRARTTRSSSPTCRTSTCRSTAA